MRLACTAAPRWPFDVASARLEERAGVALDDKTIRRHVHRAADSEAFAARWRPRARGLGIDPDGPLTVLGDGEAWSWTAALVATLDTPEGTTSGQDPLP